VVPPQEPGSGMVAPSEGSDAHASSEASPLPYQPRQRRGLGTTGQRLEEDPGLDEHALHGLDEVRLQKASPTLESMKEADPEVESPSYIDKRRR